MNQTNIPDEAMLPIALGIITFALLFLLAYYIYMSLCVYKIAKKTNTENAWMAWIPIINIILMLNIAKKPLWWIVLYFIPLANIVVSILVWMEIAKAVNKPDWVGILIIVPFVNIFVPGYLAFSKMEATISIQPPVTPVV